MWVGWLPGGLVGWILGWPTCWLDRRLAAWPCRTYDRVRLAIAAEEPTLPPVDWLPEWRPARQQRLFQ